MERKTTAIRLELAEGVGVRVETEYDDGSTHHTIYGSAEDVLDEITDWLEAFHDEVEEES